MAILATNLLLPCCLCCAALSIVLSQEAKRGLGASAVFIARNRFAVLDKASGQIQVRQQQGCLGGWVGREGNWGTWWGVGMVFVACGGLAAVHARPQLFRRGPRGHAAFHGIER